MLSFRPFWVRAHNLLLEGTRRAGEPLHNGVENGTLTRSHVRSKCSCVSYNRCLTRA